MRRSSIRLLFVSLSLLVAVPVAACGSSSTGSSTGTSTGTGGAGSSATGSLTVSAAASLTGAFTTIVHDFEQANPGATVTVNFGSSGQLESQIESGAPADVAAFADEVTMAKLADQQLLATPARVFATNELVIVTKPGNPSSITSLADLAAAGTVALCATTAPCGRYAAQVLQQAGVTIPTSHVTQGQDVKTTLAAVADGDAVAGIVYLTDARAAGAKVATVTIPPDQNAVARYPLGVLASTPSRALADAFSAWVLGPQGQAALASAGFGPP
jgi:molybdate transport system substrate-binding protein